VGGRGGGVLIYIPYSRKKFYYYFKRQDKNDEIPYTGGDKSEAPGSSKYYLKINSYSTENTLHLSYKDQPVNAVQGNIRCLL
jgi:hypothetical protein